MKKTAIYIVLLTVLSFNLSLQAAPLRPELPEVKKAIKKALPYLAEKIALNATTNTGIPGTGASVDKPNGYAMLNLLAYIEGHRALGEEHPYRMKEVISEIKYLSETGIKITNTYEVGLAAMLLSGAAKELHNEKDKKYRKIHDKAMQLLEHYKLCIENSISPDGSWGYTCDADKPYDRGQNHSTGQYALLALEAAKSCDIEISKKVIKLATKAFLNSQLSDGGWGYKVNDNDWGGAGSYAHSYPAMTTVGLASLVILNEDQKDSKIKKAMEKAVKYMSKNYTPKELRDISNGFNSWWSYSMYCVERAGVFMEVDFFGKLDWYDLGAREMIDLQQKNGCIPPMPPPNTDKAQSFNLHSDTAFAVLFLSKGSAAVRSKYNIRAMTFEESRAVALQSKWEELGPDKTARPDKLKAFIANLNNNPREVIDLFFTMTYPGDTTPYEHFTILQKHMKGSTDHMPKVTFSDNRDAVKRLVEVACETPVAGGFSKAQVQNIDKLASEPDKSKKGPNKMMPGAVPQSDPWATLEMWSLVHHQVSRKDNSGSPLDRICKKYFSKLEKKLKKEDESCRAIDIYEWMSKKRKYKGEKWPRHALELTHDEWDDVMINAPLTASWLLTLLEPESYDLQLGLYALKVNMLDMDRSNLSTNDKRLMQFWYQNNSLFEKPDSTTPGETALKALDAVIHPKESEEPDDTTIDQPDESSDNKPEEKAPSLKNHQILSEILNYWAAEFKTLEKPEPVQETEEN